MSEIHCGLLETLPETRILRSRNLEGAVSKAAEFHELGICFTLHLANS